MKSAYSCMLINKITWLWLSVHDWNKIWLLNTISHQKFEFLLDRIHIQIFDLVLIIKLYVSLFFMILYSDSWKMSQHLIVFYADKSQLNSNICYQLQEFKSSSVKKKFVLLKEESYYSIFVFLHQVDWLTNACVMKNLFSNI